MRALVYLARDAERGELVTADRISAEAAVPRRLLARVMAKLSRAGLLRGQGLQGAYLFGSGHARHEVVGGVAHPGHRGLRVGQGEAPGGEPAVHLADLVLLGVEDVGGEHAYLLVLGAPQRDLGHLHRLRVVLGHVPGEPGLRRTLAGIRFA